MERIENAIKILQAFYECKIIESIYYDGFTDYVEITNVDQLMLALYKNKPIRIKKEPTYQPYANAEEFMTASKEHGNWLHVGGSLNNLYEIFSKVTNDGVVDCDGNVLTFKYLLNQNSVWYDGTPCGIKN